MRSCATTSVTKPTTMVKIIAFENKGETHSGRFAVQYRYACGNPTCANIEKIAGHISTMNRSPRPVGPKAQALSKLVTTPDESIRAFVLKTSLKFRFSMNSSQSGEFQTLIRKGTPCRPHNLFVERVSLFRHPVPRILTYSI